MILMSKRRTVGGYFFCFFQQVSPLSKLCSKSPSCIAFVSLKSPICVRCKLVRYAPLCSPFPKSYASDRI